MPRRSLAFLALSAVISTATHAQALRPQFVPLESGRLVRVHLPDSQLLRGHLLAPFAPGSVTLVLCLAPGTPCTVQDSVNLRRLPATSVSAIDVHTRTRAPEGSHPRRRSTRLRAIHVREQGVRRLDGGHRNSGSCPHRPVWRHDRHRLQPFGAGRAERRSALLGLETAGPAGRAGARAPRPLCW